LSATSISIFLMGGPHFNIRIKQQQVKSKVYEF
jgi:hypothetical protein